MSDIRTLLKSAASRLSWNAFLSRLHIVAIVIAGIALLLVLASKLTPAFDVPWLWVAPGLGVVALAVAAIMWSRRRATEQQVAIAVDNRLDLREKISTALHLGDRSDAFALAAVEDAVLVARDARTREALRRKFPIEAPGRWWIAPGLIVAALLSSFLLPQGNLFAGSSESGLTAQAPEEVVRTLESTVEAIRANDELADELKDVFEQLDPNAMDSSALKSPDGARREAIKKLSDLSKRLDEITDGEKGRTDEALKDALRQLKTPDEGPARDLAKALAEGDFKSAKEALAEIQKKAESGGMSEEQKQQLAEQLENLGQQMQQLAQQQQTLKDALEKAGMDPNLANNPQQLQQQLQQNQQLTDQQKQQLQDMANAQQAAAQACQGMGQAMGQMAQGMGQGNGQQMQQGASQMGQSLSDAEALQQMLKQAQAMANKLQGQCQGLGQGLGMQGQGMGQNPGQGQGGEAPITQTPTRSRTEQAANQNNPADVIANTLFDGPLIKGESTATFKNAALSAAESYADNVEDDQLPRRYHEAVKKYFGDLEDQAREESSSTESADDVSSDGD
ncbi:MAG: hypothetical protein ACR2GY_10020 [Phycisphaerales bacterium]